MIKEDGITEWQENLIETFVFGRKLTEEERTEIKAFVDEKRTMQKLQNKR